MRPVTDGDGSPVCVPARPHAHTHVREIRRTRHHLSPVTALSRGSPRCLIPFDRREGLSTLEAAVRANRTERTIRMWCRDHDIGRHVAGGPWLVSRVALAMFLDGDAEALRAYLAGDRASRIVTHYFASEALGDLLVKWKMQSS